MERNIMKNNLKYFLAAPLLLGMLSCSDDTSDKDQFGNLDNTFKEVTFEKIYNPDTEKAFKNPYMGWTLYTSNGLLYKDNPTTYWALQDEAAQRYAGVLYIRYTWDKYEPAEGVYAWDVDEDFKGLIQGALDRGLRLALRIIANSKDSGKQPAVPQYVLDGSETYTYHAANDGANQQASPYPDDPFFLEKYTKFIKALGEKFNDPRIVDYVDCTGLGWWGEEHNIKWLDENANHLKTMKTIMKAYKEAFDKCIVVTNFQRKHANEETLAFEELNLCARRDGYASQHFPVAQQQRFAKLFPTHMLVAESCYSDASTGGITAQEGGKWPTWRAYYTQVVDEALQTHANYLDLRTPAETKIYLNEARDQVKRFVSKGGYRIYPEKLDGSIKDGKLTVNHTWKNLGVGLLPNNHLGYKYKIAFALFNDKDELVSKWYSDKVEVSKLVGEDPISATDKFELGEIAAGKYQQAVGIVNKNENDSKDITLAIKYPKVIEGEWVYVSDIELKNN